jgi:hypothetical protein
MSNGHDKQATTTFKIVVFIGIILLGLLAWIGCGYGLFQFRQ